MSSSPRRPQSKSGRGAKEAPAEAPGGQCDESLWRGVELFNRGEFFECHEVWEDIWREEASPLRIFYQALIQVAVAFHHARNSNVTGAERQLRKALRKLRPFRPVCRGIDTDSLFTAAGEWLEQLRLGRSPDGYPRITGPTDAAPGDTI